MKRQLEDFASYAPVFYEAVKDFPDFRLGCALDANEIAELEKKLEFPFPQELKTLFGIASSVTMYGLSIGSQELGTILMPQSEALIIGYFYLNNPADRLLILPQDPSIHYLEQHNGAIHKLAPNMRDFLDKALIRYL